MKISEKHRKAYAKAIEQAPSGQDATLVAAVNALARGDAEAAADEFGKIADGLRGDESV